MTKQDPDQIDRGDAGSQLVNEKEAASAVDHTGSHRKTDPAEIALVRKLDWRIMVSVSFWSQRRMRKKKKKRRRKTEARILGGHV